jgi:hypothetical protein
MKLSEQELRWLSRCEKRERQWLLITRWVWVGNGVFCLGAGAYLTYLLFGEDSPSSPLLLFIPLFFYCFAGLWFGVTFSKWRGDIKLRLLLRLIREHEDKSA